MAARSPLRASRNMRRGVLVDLFGEGVSAIVHSVTALSRRQ